MTPFNQGLALKTLRENTVIEQRRRTRQDQHNQNDGQQAKAAAWVTAPAAAIGPCWKSAYQKYNKDDE